MQIRQIATMAVVTLIFLFAYLPVLKSLVSVWMRKDEYSHGFFIIPVAIYIVWQNRRKYKEFSPNMEWIGFMLLLSALSLYILSVFARIATMASVTLPLTIAGLVLFIYGPKMLKLTAFPICFLLLMIPVPDQIYTSMTIHLQLFVSKISVFIASMTGVPILREGNLIHLPDRVLEVVQACSGIRSLISLLTLCLIVGYFGLKSNALRLIFSTIAVPVAVIVNAIRVLVMILALYYFQIDLTSEAVHAYFGMVIFAVAFVIVMGAYKGFSKWEKHLTLKSS